jgi:hypothetical protein
MFELLMTFAPDGPVESSAQRRPDEAQGFQFMPIAV